MGNVHAFSGPPPPPPPTTTPAFPKSPSDSEEVSGIENPGPLEEIHNKCKSEYLKGSLFARKLTCLLFRCISYLF